MKHKSIYGFHGDLNPIGTEGFIVKGVSTIANQIVSFLSSKLATKLPSKGYSLNSQRVSSLSSCLLTIYFAMIQLSTGSNTLTSDSNLNSEPSEWDWNVPPYYIVDFLVSTLCLTVTRYGSHWICRQILYETEITFFNSIKCYKYSNQFSYSLSTQSA